MNKIQLNKTNAILVQNTLNDFKNNNLLSDEKFNELIDNIEILKFDYKKLSKWSFIFSILCFIISITNLNGLIFQYKLFRIFLSLILSGIFYYFGFNKKNTKRKLLYEFFVFLGVLCTSWFIGEIGTYNFLKNSYGIIFFSSAVIYAIVAFFGQSNLVLIFSLLNLGVWFGGQIGYMSEYASYFLGMSKPLNFVFFGIILLIISYIINIIKIKKIDTFFKTFLSMGLLYSFLSLWILSIFGNGTKFENINTIKFELICWSLVFGISSLISLYIGLKYDNYTLRSYGIVFFLINLYTKYFEYFWTDSNKFIFFTILGISFYIIGTKSEKIYIGMKNFSNKKI